MLVKEKALRLWNQPNARRLSHSRIPVHHESTPVDTQSTNYEDGLLKAFRKVELPNFNGNNSIEWLAMVGKFLWNSKIPNQNWKYHYLLYV